MARIAAPLFVTAGLWGFFHAHPLTGATPNPFLNVAYLLWGSASLYVGYARMPDGIPVGHAHLLGLFFLLLGWTGLHAGAAAPTGGARGLDLTHVALGVAALASALLALPLARRAAAPQPS